MLVGAERVAMMDRANFEAVCRRARCTARRIVVLNREGVEY